MLLSRYSPWNDIWDWLIDNRVPVPGRGVPPSIDRPEWQEVFDLSKVPRRRWTDWDGWDIQAALPYFDRAWIRSVSVWPRLAKGQRYWRPRRRRKPV